MSELSMFSVSDYMGLDSIQGGSSFIESSIKLLKKPDVCKMVWHLKKKKLNIKRNYYSINKTQ